jgi:hypothetical protein
VAILVVAAGLRVRGLGFGLPMAESRPDEMTIAYQAMKFGTGDLNPHSFNYPSLFKYVSFGLFGAWYVIGKLLGVFQGQDDFLLSFFQADGSFRLLMRSWSALAGVATVALLGAAPGRLWGAALLAVCMLHVRDSHFGVTDPTLVLFCVGSVICSTILAHEGTLRAATWAGILGGLAASTKYNGALCALPLLIGALVSPGFRGPLVLRGAVCMVAAFLAGSPYVLLDFATFRKDFLYEMNHLAEGHHVDVGNAWLYHLTASLRYGMGVPLLAAGVLGLFVGVWREWRTGLVWASFPIVWYALMGRGETAFFRYMLPAVPFLCAGAGMLVEQVRSAHLRAVILALIAAPTLWSSLETTRLMAAGDTRADMGAYIEANVADGTMIVHGGAYTGAPMLQRNVLNQTREYEAKAGRADASGFRKPDDPKWYRKGRPTYDVQLIEKEGIDYASTATVERVLAFPPPYLLLETYPLRHYAHVPEQVRRLAEERYELVHEERAARGPTADAVFDQQDAFYVPVAGFAAFTRMGPDLRLYRLRDSVDPAR